MAILFNELDNTFTLHTKNTTYQMKVDQYGVLLHLYYGARSEGNMDYLLTYTDRGFSGNLYDAPILWMCCLRSILPSVPVITAVLR